MLVSMLPGYTAGAPFMYTREPSMDGHWLHNIIGFPLPKAQRSAPKSFKP